ncbi:IS110 family transposase [Streptomyces bathyalis]|uniref:IS110 family transposase n=1 Tax=Streptomyces bathyalis TaxID=2710756 RepID=A0A7T1TCI7_9ACTN|nr:IS110 family transposase [Streptomyces bathyalis]
MLAEIRDDRTRFDTARDLKAYAGSTPITRECGKSRRVCHRRIKNSRLAETGRRWAFAGPTASPGSLRAAVQRTTNLRGHRRISRTVPQSPEPGRPRQAG